MHATVGIAVVVDTIVDAAKCPVRENDDALTS